MKTELHYDIKLHGDFGTYPYQSIKDFKNWYSGPSLIVALYAIWQAHKVMKKVGGVYYTMHIRRVAK